ncbi:MAG: tRNA lysidine(34) synthetase TilS [Candidatus Zixiibacteriota bacterium]
MKKTIYENNLIEKSDSILVALSGGPDSSALLHLLSQLKKEISLKLMAVYINHNIRKNDAKKEERFCRKLCDNLSVKLFIVFEDIPKLAKKMKKGLEETARDFRYETFDKLCNQHNIEKVALGHHINDRVETILFRIIRGTGNTGLLGIPVKRKQFIRPLYNVTKDEIYDYLKKHKLNYCTDKSNSNTKIKRNFIRYKLLKIIRENLNSEIDSALINLSETTAEEESFLESIALKHIKKIVTRTAGGKIELALADFRSYDKWLRRRLLRYCLAELSDDRQMPDKIVVDRIDCLCNDGGKAVSLPGNLQAVLIDKKLVVFRKQEKRFCKKLQLDNSLQLSYMELVVKVSLKSRRKVKLVKQKQARVVLLDYSKLVPPLIIRNIKAGDRFKPLGLKGTKKIGDYLTDRKVDKIYRDEIPVICDARGIVWLTGFEISDRVKIDKKTNEVLRIEITRQSKSRVKTF